MPKDAATISAKALVQEAELVALVRKGYVIEVIVQETPFKKAATWHGEWVIRLTDDEESFEAYLVTARGYATKSVRVIKTVNGLLSFMTELGFATVGIPMEKGERARHQLQNEAVASDSVPGEAAHDREVQSPTMPDASYPAPRIASYVSLTEAGHALLLLDTQAMVSPRAAGVLAAHGWAEPDLVRLRSDDGRSLSFEFIDMTLDGTLQLKELREHTGFANRPWGQRWNIIEDIAGLYGPVEEAQMVYQRSLLDLMTWEGLVEYHEKSATGWYQGDLSPYPVEVVRKGRND